MSDVLFPVLVLVIWFALGVASVLYLGRHGRRSPAWYVMGLALGPILVPIALELGNQRGVVLSRTVSGAGRVPLLTVLAAVDGSWECEAALDDAMRSLSPRDSQLVLLAVLDPDEAENDPEAEVRASDLLASQAARLPPAWLPPVLEVVMGDPGPMILERAAVCGADLIVMGRRGRGLTERILGSVADHVVRRSARPVLLGRAPARSTAR